MVVVVVDVLQPVVQSGVVENSAVVVEVLRTVDSPTETLESIGVIETVAPGGTVANVSWGYDFPENPVEGQIFIKVTP